MAHLENDNYFLGQPNATPSFFEFRLGNSKDVRLFSVSSIDRSWSLGGHDDGVNGLWQNHPFISAVPEPESYAMLLAGLGLLGFAARRRKQQAA